MVLMEALAMQRPVIATQIAGIPELIVDGIDGWLISAGSVDALERAHIARCSKRRSPSSSDSAPSAPRECASGARSRVEIPKLAALFDAVLRGEVGPVRTRA